jgi:3-methylcrotonyl-CoA carboxylase beta subunit
MATPYRTLTRSLHRLPGTPPLVQSSNCSRLLVRLQQRTVATYTSPHQASQISILQTNVDKNSDGFRENAAALGELTQKIAQLHEKAALGGPQKARDKHVQRGKMLVRDRVTALIDPGTSFLELSALAGYGVYEGEDVPAAGMVTGIGTVEGVMCVVVANDST